MTTSLTVKNVGQYIRKSLKVSVFAKMREVFGFKLMTTSLMKKVLSNFRATFQMNDWAFVLAELSQPNVKDFVNLADLNNRLALRQSAFLFLKKFGLKAEITTNSIKFNHNAWVLQNGNPKAVVVAGGISFTDFTGKCYVQFDLKAKYGHPRRDIQHATDTLVAYFQNLGLKPNAS